MARLSLIRYSVLKFQPGSNRRAINFLTCKGSHAFSCQRVNSIRSKMECHDIHTAICYCEVDKTRLVVEGFLGIEIDAACVNRVQAPDCYRLPHMHRHNEQCDFIGFLTFSLLSSWHTSSSYAADLVSKLDLIAPLIRCSRSSSPAMDP